MNLFLSFFIGKDGKFLLLFFAMGIGWINSVFLLLYHKVIQKLGNKS